VNTFVEQHVESCTLHAACCVTHTQHAACCTSHCTSHAVRDAWTHLLWPGGDVDADFKTLRLVRHVSFHRCACTTIAAHAPQWTDQAAPRGSTSDHKCSAQRTYAPAPILRLPVPYVRHRDRRHRDMAGNAVGAASNASARDHPTSAASREMDERFPDDLFAREACRRRAAMQT
jgi:hypothetical protein